MGEDNFIFSILSELELEQRENIDRRQEMKLLEEINKLAKSIRENASLNNQTIGDIYKSHNYKSKIYLMVQSSIEWTEMTWNPTTGCSKISQGCKFCYAEIMSKRLQAMGIEKYKYNFKVRIHPDALKIPYTWKKSKIVFVNLMSDLFLKQPFIQALHHYFIQHHPRSH